MKPIARLVRLLARLGIALAAAALLISLALVAYSVAMRYFVNQPVPWVDELVGYLLVACVMLAAGDALLQGEHLAVDLVSERLGRRGRKATLVAGLVAVALAAALLVADGWDMVAFSRMVDLRSNGYMAAPMWIPQLLVPVGALLLLLAAAVALHAALRDDGSAPKSGSPPAAGIE